VESSNRLYEQAMRLKAKRESSARVLPEGCTFAPEVTAKARRGGVAMGQERFEHLYKNAAAIQRKMELEREAVRAVLCRAVLCCAVLCCAVLCCAVLCCAVLCCAVLCCAVLCCGVVCCGVVCVVRLCVYCSFVLYVMGLAGPRLSGLTPAHDCFVALTQAAAAAATFQPRLIARSESVGRGSHAGVDVGDRLFNEAKRSNERKRHLAQKVAQEEEVRHWLVALVIVTAAAVVVAWLVFPVRWQWR
jgi:hypothetical protein